MSNDQLCLEILYPLRYMTNIILFYFYIIDILYMITLYSHNLFL